MFVLTWFISVYNFSPPTTPKIKTNKKLVLEQTAFLPIFYSKLSALGRLQGTRNGTF